MEQVKMKDAGDQEAMHYDADYIRALEYGMPPCAGRRTWHRPAGNAAHRQPEHPGRHPLPAYAPRGLIQPVTNARSPADLVSRWRCWENEGEQRHANHPTSRLHPLVAVAAISVTILSAVGIATMTGLIAVSKGQEEVSVDLPKEVAPAITHPAPVPKPAARKTATAPRPLESPIYQPAPQVAQAPVVVEAPKP